MTFPATETKIIRETLKRLVDRDRIFRNPDLDLSMLATAAGMPPYRLLIYFNNFLGMSFPEWLNRIRIDCVCFLLLAHPETNVLDSTFDAGYASKSVFNTQFLKLKECMPSEYRARTPTGKAYVP